MQRIDSATDGIAYMGQGMGVMSYMPSGEEDIVGQKARTASAVTWWAASSIALCIGFLLHSGADVRGCRSPRRSACAVAHQFQARFNRAPMPWRIRWTQVPNFVAAILVLEFILSVRRIMTGSMSTGVGTWLAGKTVQRQRLRHFMSVRLHDNAPTDEIVATFLSLDQVAQGAPRSRDPVDSAASSLWDPSTPSRDPLRLQPAAPSCKGGGREVCRGGRQLQP